jgi:Tol biopolymer transport system component
MRQNRIKLATKIKTRNLSRGLICCLLLVAGTTAFGQQFSAWSAPVSLGPTINTTALEGCPAISRDGLSLFFASNRNGGAGGLDIYVTHRESLIDPWGAPANLGATINGASNDYCPTLSTDGHLLFFASNRPGGCGGVDIYVSRRQDKSQDFGDRGWGPPQNLGCTVNSVNDDFGPNYFEVDTGGMLYFNSNRDSSGGDQNIYAATRGTDDASGMPSFGVPTPVFELNTASNDQQPSVGRGGLEVIFSSDRPGGQGGFDLWVATRATTSDLWSAPQNLGAPVNSSAADQRSAISWDGTELYFGSTRPGGLGSQDLYVSTRNKITGNQ